MHLARFSYDVLPINRQRAIEFIKREVEAARGKGLNARLLVRGPSSVQQSAARLRPTQPLRPLRWGSGLPPGGEAV